MVRTSSVSRTGQKLVKLCFDNRHSRIRTQRNTSLWTIGAVTFRRISTSFSWIVGSWVKKWFFSPVKTTKDSLRTFKERRSISYSRFVNILADGAVATLAVLSSSLSTKYGMGMTDHSHKSSGKAVLSASKSDLIISLQASASSGRELKKRLSLNRSITGAFHAFSAAWMRVISRSIDRITLSISRGLSILWAIRRHQFRFHAPRSSSDSWTHDVVNNISTYTCHFVVVHQKFAKVGERRGSNKLSDLSRVRRHKPLSKVDSPVIYTRRNCSV